MYIRRTTIKSRRTGEPYYTYRLVESLRTADGVRQCTLLNLGISMCRASAGRCWRSVSSNWPVGNKHWGSWS